MIEFKRQVYKDALEELSLLLFQPKQFRHAGYRPRTPAPQMIQAEVTVDVKIEIDVEDTSAESS